MTTSWPPLRPIQVLFLFKLLCTGEEPKKGDAQPKLKTAERDALRDMGLIAYEKRKAANGRAAEHIVLTDAAWAWAAAHLDAPFSMTPNGARALAGLLPRLKAYLDRTGTPLAELLAPPDTAAVTEHDLPAVIRAAYLACTGGKWNVRVFLRDLRPLLAQFGREEVDAALLAMQQAGGLVLYTNENPGEIGPDDEAAAVNVLGELRQVVYMWE